MSINLHISAESAKDFFKDLSELTAGFYMSSTATGGLTAGGTTAAASAQIVEEPAAAPEPKAARKPRAAKTETSADNATEQAGSTTESSTSSATAPSEPLNEAASTATSTQDDEQDDGKPGPFPDFDTEVTPAVLKAVREKGKEYVSGILGEFGVAKASELKDNQFQELIDRLKD